MKGAPTAGFRWPPLTLAVICGTQHSQTGPQQHWLCHARLAARHNTQRTHIDEDSKHETCGQYTKPSATMLGFFPSLFHFHSSEHPRHGVIEQPLLLLTVARWSKTLA